MISPGVSVTTIAPQPAASANEETDLIAIVGTATDGVPNQPTYFSDINSLIRAFGRGSLLPNSLVREAISAMPEGKAFVGIRAVDGNQSAATMSLVDSAAASVLTFVASREGTNANAGSNSAALKSGSLTAGPVLNVILNYPDRPSEVFAGIVAYAVAGGPYDAPTFIANALAAINGTTPGTQASQNWVATPGTSTLAPTLGTLFTASGGADGASNIASANILGVPGDSATRTGAYALGGTGFDFLIPAGLTDPSIVQDLLAFVAGEKFKGRVLYAFPQGSTPSTMVATQTENALVAPRLIVCGFWDYVFDALSGTSIWVSPMGKIAGIIASLDPEEDPCNKPYVGAIGVNQTEATQGQGLDSGDADTLAANGIMYLAKPIPRGNVFGLPHGLASDGSDISDGRVQDLVAYDIAVFLGNYVGEDQNVPPTDAPSSAADTDVTRTAVRNGAKGIGARYTASNVLQSFSAVCDMTNNIRSTVLAKQLILNIAGITRAGISFALGYVQVGSSVEISGPT